MRSVGSAAVRRVRTSMMATVDVWQTQTNRAKFSGTPVNKVAWHAEGASQFTNRS